MVTNHWNSDTVKQYLKVKNIVVLANQKQCYKISVEVTRILRLLERVWGVVYSKNNYLNSNQKFMSDSYG